jgi:hypothetical protein
MLQRKKLITVLVLASTMAGLLNVAADFWRLKHYRPRAHRWSINTYALQQTEETVDILVLGSSRVLQGINPNVLSSTLQKAGHDGVTAFNVAQPGTAVVTRQIQLHDLIRSNGCPGIVVFEVSPGALNQNGRWWRDSPEYASFRDFPVLLPGVTSFERLDFALAISLHGGMRLYDRLSKAPKSHTTERALMTRGSQHGDLTWKPETMGKGPRQKGIRKTRNFFNNRVWTDMHIGSSTRQALRQSADLAESCSARFVLLRMPTLIWYRTSDLERVNQPFLEAIDELATSHDFVFFDSNARETGVLPGHFADAIHLNLGGSIVFSELLAREVLLPLLE